MAAPPARSVLTMPLLGMKSAPELFQGDHTHVCSFLDHYECLCAYHNVTSDQEMVESILQYCNARVREIIEGMAHYYTPDWANLKADLLKYFDADLSDERFFERHLKSFALESRMQPIMTLQDFRAYNCGFICIGGWLKNKGRILVDEYNRYFWAGLSPVFCGLVETRLRTKDPNLDISSYDDVCQSAEEVLHHNHFDADDLDFLGPCAAPAPQAQPNASHCSDGRDDSVRPLLPSHEARRNLENLEKEGPTAHKQDEVETLIKSLSHMSLNDPDYSLLYYRAIKMDPD
ncbi:hypothetical protein M404DRAFT_161707, partial [Pisolithus tinctorius Marx 270]